MSTFLINPTEEQEKVVTAFLEALDISFTKEEKTETLPPHVLEGIARGLADIEAGRFITHEEFVKRIGVEK
jgi:hypothetical protein